MDASGRLADFRAFSLLPFPPQLIAVPPFSPPLLPKYAFDVGFRKVISDIEQAALMFFGDFVPLPLEQIEMREIPATGNW